MPHHLWLLYESQQAVDEVLAYPKQVTLKARRTLQVNSICVKNKFDFNRRLENPRLWFVPTKQRWSRY
jgi:hypothetical protein